MCPNECDERDFVVFKVKDVGLNLGPVDNYNEH